MTNGVKISELTSAASLDGTESLPVVQAGSTVKATAEQIKELAQTDVPAANITGTLPVAHGGTGATTAQDAAQNLAVASQVLSLAALKALTAPSGTQTVITQYRSTAGDGGGGTWVWRSGNQSANITADTESGVWAAPDSDSTGASGAWQRQYSGALNVLWFGAVGDWNGSTGTDNGDAINAALSYVNSGGGGDVLLPADSYYTTTTITVRARCRLVGEGRFALTSYGSAIVGDATLSPVILMDGGGASASTALFNISVTRSTGTGSTDSVGVSVYRTDSCLLEDVYIRGHEYGLEVNAASTALNCTRLFTGEIVKAHVWLKQMAENTFTDCRFGRNGGADVACETYIRLQTDEASTVDTVNFIRCQFNQSGATALVNCLLDAVGHASGGSIFNFVSCHAEHFASGANVIKTDAATPSLNRIKFSTCSITTLYSTNNFFAIDAATVLSDFQMHNCTIGFAMNVEGASGSDFVISGCVFESSTTMTVSGADKLAITGNVIQTGLILSGSVTTGVVSGNSLSGTLTTTMTGDLQLVGNTKSASGYVPSYLGRLYVGPNPASTTSLGVAGYNHFLRVAGTGGEDSSQLLARFSSTAANSARLDIARSYSDTFGTNTLTPSGTRLGDIVFYGADGTSYIPSARIRAEVYGTSGTDDMPGRLVFGATLDNTASPTDRLFVEATGFVRIVGAWGRGAPVTKTSNFSVGVAENWIINDKSGSSLTVTLPVASNWIGREIMVSNNQAQTVISASSNVVPLGGSVAGTAILPAFVGAWASLVSDGTNWVITNSNSADSPVVPGSLVVSGTGQATSSFDTSTGLGGSVLLKDSGSSTNNGGAVVFGASQGYFAAIKGLITSGSNNTTGNVSFATRRVSTDSTLTEAMRIRPKGYVSIGGTGGDDRILTIEGDATGAASVRGISNTPTIKSDVTTFAGYRTEPVVDNATFTLATYRHFFAVQGTIGGSATVTDQFGFAVDSTLTGATNNYGFYSNIASGTGRWNFYSAGTAANYFAGATTFNAAITYGGVTLSNSVTGTGSMVLGTSPTLTTPLFTGVPVTTVSTTNGTIEGLKLVLNASSPATSDSIYTSFWVNNSSGTSVEMARAIGRGGVITAGAEAGQFIIATRSSGALTNRILVATTTFNPATNDGMSLGSSSLNFSDLFLATGAVINYANGNYTITHSSGLLTTSGGLTLGGALKLSNAYAAGAPAATGYVTLQDSTGTTYKVLVST